MARSFLLIHGMCCTNEIWSNWKPHFEARGVRVFAPTLRPQDRVRRNPPKSLHALRFTDYVSDLELEVDRIEQETGHKPTLVGHSMGGLLAQALAERNRGNAAVFISPTPPAGVRDASTTMFWGGFVVARALGLVPGALPPSRPITQRMVFNRVPREQWDGQHKGMVHESREVFADFRTHAIDEKKIRIPVLTIAARRDLLVTAAITRRTAKKYEAIGGSFKQYDDHGHWIYAEPGWETPANDILEWVEANTDTV